MKAIVAFEVEITSIENVFKLSQNRDEKSFRNIMDKLNTQGSDARFIADEMKKRQQQLFGK
jgi:transcriptional regulator